jgi:hypothetical protein
LNQVPGLSEAPENTEGQVSADEAPAESEEAG